MSNNEKNPDEIKPIKTVLLYSKNKIDFIFRYEKMEPCLEIIVESINSNSTYKLKILKLGVRGEKCEPSKLRAEGIVLDGSFPTKYFSGFFNIKDQKGWMIPLDIYSF